jgi:hypothetical protein
MKNIVIGAIVVVLVGAAAVFLLLHFFGTEEARPQLEAIRVASTIVLGAGGAVALILAARRQRSTELTLQENARIAAENAADRAKDLAQREAVAEHNRLDALERRITDLYILKQQTSSGATRRLSGLPGYTRWSGLQTTRQRSKRRSPTLYPPTFACHLIGQQKSQTNRLTIGHARLSLR